MVGIQLYIETETIKWPFSQNWFEVYSDFALQFILLSIEKERHKIVADYLGISIDKKYHALMKACGNFHSEII